MSNRDFLEKIDTALFNAYIEKDYSKSSAHKFDEDYAGQKEKYNKLYKKLLFKGRASLRKRDLENIISLPRAIGLMADLNQKHKGKVFPIFKKLVEQEGLLVNYRNFEKMTEEEMINILEQVNLTKILDKLDQELNDK